MNKFARAFLLAYVANVALMNGVDAAAVTTSKFTVEPSVQQRLEDKVQESSEFLSKINIVPVDEMKGEVLGLGVGGTIAGRTNTAAGNRRVGIDPTGLSSHTYECKQTNFDTALKYAKLDMWAKFKDFEVRIQRAILQRCSLDRILIGFNGVNAAVATNRVTYPKLQDVNYGWLYHIRQDAPERVLDEVEDGKVAGKVTYGTDGDYATLDALVWDAKQSLIAEHAREDTGLVVIVGGALLHDKYFPMINKSEDPTEQIARDVIMSTKRLGGLAAYQVPGFPANTILITRFDNLSIYYQDGKRRRHIKDEPELDQITDYQSSNEAYVIEDYDYIALVENIQLNDLDPEDP